MIIAICSPSDADGRRGGEHEMVRMIYVQHGDGGAVCIPGIEDKCTRAVFETRDKKHEDMKQEVGARVV